MMIVVAIIVVLAGLGIRYMGGAIDDSYKAKAVADIKSITDAAVQYKAQHGGQWPQTIDDLYTKDQNGYGPYLEERREQDQLVGHPLHSTIRRRQTNQGVLPDVYVQMPSGGRVVNWSKNVQRERGIRVIALVPGESRRLHAVRADRS